MAFTSQPPRQPGQPWTRLSDNVPRIRCGLAQIRRDDGGAYRTPEGLYPQCQWYSQGSPECGERRAQTGAAAHEDPERNVTKRPGLGLLGSGDASHLCEGKRPPQGGTGTPFVRAARLRGPDSGGLQPSSTRRTPSAAGECATASTAMGNEHGGRRGPHGRPDQTGAGTHTWPLLDRSRPCTYDAAAQRQCCPSHALRAAPGLLASTSPPPVTTDAYPVPTETSFSTVPVDTKPALPDPRAPPAAPEAVPAASTLASKLSEKRKAYRTAMGPFGLLRPSTTQLTAEGTNAISRTNPLDSGQAGHLIDDDNEELNAASPGFSNME